MDEDELHSTLIQLREQHRDLDDSILALDRSGTFDQLQVQRLKRHKLSVKDRISIIEDRLMPNIIA